MRKYLDIVKSFSKDEDGAALAEYAILLAIVLAIAATTLTTFSSNISGVFDRAGTKMSTIGVASP